jgi:hypothetical protein
MRNHTLITLFIIALHISSNGFCQCTTAGPSNGNSFGNNATIGSFTWGSTANAKTSNNQYASASILLSALSSINSQYLTAENFGFTIPVTASICGIQVSVQHLASGITNILGITLGAISDNSVMIVKNGVISGSEHKIATAWTGANSTATYGGSADTWGITSWLPSDINASNFGVAVSANLSALVGVTLGANIDYISITVSYIDPGILSISLQNFMVSKKQNTNFISWSIRSPNNFSGFIIQRSYNQISWHNISEISSVSEKTEYSYTDEYPPNGMSYYRLQLQNENGTVEYSDIRSVDQQNENGVSVFPNPATSYLNVHPKNSIHSITIKDIQGRTLRSFIPNNSSENISIDVSRLSSGLYLLQVDRSVYKFLKSN